MCAPRPISGPAAGGAMHLNMTDRSGAPTSRRKQRSKMMSKQQQSEVFMPPNLLKAKVGNGGFSGVDTAAIERAETAMEALKGEFADWALEDVRRLIDARERFAKSPDAASRAALLRAAHDIKGQAA